MKKIINKKIQNSRNNKSKYIRKNIKNTTKNKNKIYKGGSYIERPLQTKLTPHAGKNCYNGDVDFTCTKISPIPNKVNLSTVEKKQLKKMLKNCYTIPYDSRIFDEQLRTEFFFHRFEYHNNLEETYFCYLHHNPRPGINGDAGSIYAFCFCSLISADTIYIDTVCTSNTQLRQHCCERLLEEVVNVFTQVSFENYNLKLDVRISKYKDKGLSPNWAACQCYEKLGFRFDRTIPGKLENDGINCPMFRPAYGRMTEQQWNNTLSCNQVINGNQSQKLVTVRNNGTLSSLVPIGGNVNIFLLRELNNNVISAYVNDGPKLWSNGENTWIIKNIISEL